MYVLECLGMCLTPIKTAKSGFPLRLKEGNPLER